MSNNKLIFAALITLVVLIAGSLVIIEWFGPQRTIELQFTGEAGWSLVGEIEVDGKIQAVEEKLPAKFKFQARQLRFALVAPESKPDQQIGIRLMVDDGFFVGGSAPGVRGEVYAPRLLGSLRERAWFGAATIGKIRP